jgi:hypothetical protein
MVTTTQNEDTFQQGNLDWDIPSPAESNVTFDPIPSGMYEVEIVGMSDPYETQYQDQKPKMVIAMRFEIRNDPEFEGREFRAWPTRSLNEKSTLLKIVKAVQGKDYDPKARLDPKTLMNKRFNAVVETPNPSELPIGKTPWPKLRNAMPIRGLAQRPQVSQVNMSDVRNDPDVGDDEIPF